MSIYLSTLFPQLCANQGLIFFQDDCFVTGDVKPELGVEGLDQDNINPAMLEQLQKGRTRSRVHVQGGSDELQKKRRSGRAPIRCTSDDADALQIVEDGRAVTHATDPAAEFESLKTEIGIMWEQAEFQRAYQYLEAIEEEVLAGYVDPSLERADFFDLMAHAYLRAGRFRDARRHYLLALRECRQVLPQDDQRLAEVYFHLADVCFSLKRFAAASNNITKAHKVALKIDDLTTCSQIMNTLTHYVTMCFYDGRVEDAMVWMQTIIEFAKTKFGVFSYEHAGALYQAANAYANLGELSRARQLYSESIATASKMPVTLPRLEMVALDGGGVAERGALDDPNEKVANILSIIGYEIMPTLSFGEKGETLKSPLDDAKLAMRAYEAMRQRLMTQGLQAGVAFEDGYPIVTGLRQEDVLKCKIILETIIVYHSLARAHFAMGQLKVAVQTIEKALKPLQHFGGPFRAIQMAMLEDLEYMYRANGNDRQAARIQARREALEESSLIVLVGDGEAAEA